jgi:multidrug resistance efflux pump
VPTTYPKLRRDLIVSRQQKDGEVVFILKDPEVGRFIRFKEPEYYIAQQLDGDTSSEEVRRRGQEHFGAPLAEATVERFTTKLQTLGLLESTGEPRTPTASRQPAPRLRGNILSLRWKMVNPNAFLEALVPKLRLVFTRPFAWFSVAVILLAIGVMFSHWSEIHRLLPGLYRVETIPLAWATLLGIVVGHELSHGLTCKRFGGKVDEIGLLLIYLQPAMYCNVSDAWMFPEKGKRLLVTLAGAWFEIFAWAVATLFWRFTEPGTAPNFLALLVATTLGIKTLFNLNPLIKLDGYYLLSDWLEVPNLRRRAFGYLGSRIRGFWRPSNDAARSTTPRERRIYWLYGVSAAIYSTWLIGFILLSLGSFLVARYQSWGFALFVLTVGLVFRNPLRQVRRSLTSQFTAARGILRALKRLVKTLVVLTLLGALLYFVHTDLKVAGEFRVLPLHNAEVRAEVEGIIEEVAHDEGDVLNAGELIVRLSDRDFRAELEKVKGEIAEKEARLKMLIAGARPEEVELAQTTITKNQERVKYAQFYLEMERKLYQDKLSSKKDFELAEETTTLRQKELEESKGTLKLLAAGSRPEEIEATQAEVARLVSARGYLEDQLRRVRVVSPISGVVTTHRLKEKVGATVRKGDFIVAVQELRAVTAEISIPEQEISEVRPGQDVVMKARAYFDASFRGKVTAISPVASKPAEGIAQRNFVVTTQLDNADLLLKPEMSGNAKIYCGERRLYEVFFRRFVRFIRVEFWSWW